MDCVLPIVNIFHTVGRIGNKKIFFYVCMLASVRQYLNRFKRDKIPLQPSCRPVIISILMAVSL
jgi:hypothetical protein